MGSMGQRGTIGTKAPSVDCLRAYFCKVNFTTVSYASRNFGDKGSNGRIIGNNLSGIS